MLDRHGRRTIRRQNYIEVSQVGVRCGKQDADVGREARDHDRSHLQILNQEVELAVVEAGMFGLKYEVVVLVGTQQLRDWLAAYSILHHVPELLPEIGAPLPEIVVDVDHRDTGVLRSASEPREIFPRRQRILEQGLA